MRHNPNNPNCPCDSCMFKAEADWRREYEAWDEEVNGEAKREFFASYQNAVLDCMRRTGRL